MIVDIITHGIAYGAGVLTGSYILKKKFEQATGMDNMLEDTDADGDDVLGLVQDLTDDLPDEHEESGPMKEVQDLAESFQDGDAGVEDLMEKAEEMSDQIDEGDDGDQ